MAWGARRGPPGQHLSRSAPAGSAGVDPVEGLCRCALAETGTLSGTSITGLGMGNGVSVNYTGSDFALLTLRGGKVGAVLTETGTSTTTKLIGITLAP